MEFRDRETEQRQRQTKTKTDKETEQTSQPHSEMAGMLELSDLEF